MVTDTDAVVSAICRSFTELVSELQADNQKLRQHMNVLAVEMGIITDWVLKTTGVELINKESEMFRLVHAADQESRNISEELTMVARISSDGALTQVQSSPNVVRHGCDHTTEDHDGEGEHRLTSQTAENHQNRVQMKKLVIRLCRLEDEPSQLQPAPAVRLESVQNKKKRGRGRPAVVNEAKICKFCQMKFQHFAEMKDHERIHTGEKPFSCHVCKKTFRVRWNRDQHIKTHTNERPHACVYCGSRFYWLQNKQIHEMIHTGERPFPCRLCGRAFRSKITHVQHMRTHTREQPYKCKTCGLAFTQQATLQRHNLIHANRKPYVCTHCGARFRQTAHKRRHEMTHTGEKPFKCSFCSKTFITKGNMESHFRKHTGERPYRCAKCEMTFSWSYGLRMHERKCHTKGKS